MLDGLIERKFALQILAFNEVSRFFENVLNGVRGIATIENKSPFPSMKALSSA